MIALETMRAHKLRSFLMLLGVILSVSTLILVVALINGTNDYIAERVANLGNGVFLIMRYGIIDNSDDFVRAVRRNKQLTYDDYVALRDGMKLPKNVGLECRSTETVRSEGQGSGLGSGLSYEDASIRGVTANIGEMTTDEVARGRFISENDNQHRSQTAMIGSEVAEKLFPNRDPLGKTVTVRGYDFTVVGVAKPVGSVLGQPHGQLCVYPGGELVQVERHAHRPDRHQHSGAQRRSCWSRPRTRRGLCCGRGGMCLRMRTTTLDYLAPTR